MIQTVLTWVQPITIIAFIVAGTCCLLIRPMQLTIGIINYLLGAINFFIFYGAKILGK